MKRIIFFILRFSGLPLIIRKLFQKKRVSVFLFHDISEQEAELAFSTLKQKYNIIPLNLLMKTFKNGKWETLPKYSVVITFDDGLISNFDILPKIKEYNIPVTIFLCTGIINTNRHFWFHKKHPAISKNDLKHKPNTERLELLKDVGFYQEKEYDNPEAMSFTQIMEMKPYVDFQAHTMFHPILPMCSDIEARNEIIQSKSFLENNLDITVDVFSYPNGNYTDREIAFCKEAGYTGAITVDFGFNHRTTDPFRLKRFPMEGTDDANELLVKASGLSEILGVLTGQKYITKYNRL